MVKNKFKRITILFLVILLVTASYVMAENIIDDDPENPALKLNNFSTQIDENIQNTITPYESSYEIVSDSIKKGDSYYISGNDVTIDYIVDGNAFIIADNVTINSQISGDVFVIANSVTITEQGYIFNNLFCISPNLNIKGIVYDIYAVGRNITISGAINRDIKLSCNTLNMSGTINRDAIITCSDIEFTQNNIKGNLEYYSKNQINIPENAVSGDITYKKLTGGESDKVQDYLLSLGTVLCLAIALWLITIWLAPKFERNSGKFLTTKKILPALGFGLLSVIIFPILSILLIALQITASVGIILLILYFVLLFISNSIFTLAVNNAICNKLDINFDIGKFGLLIVVATVLWIIRYIPYLGTLVSGVFVILGMGILITSIGKRNEIKE